MYAVVALVDTLVAKTRAWEEDRGRSFTYDGVPLLAMLDEYTMLRQDREEEKRRLRVVLFWPFHDQVLLRAQPFFFNVSLLVLPNLQDQKRFHEQLNTEQEAMFGSRPSPARPPGPKKVVGPRTNSGASNGTPSRRLSLNTHHGSSNGVRSASRDGKREVGRPAAPVNYVAIAKEDAVSPVPGSFPAPASP